jgi:UDP-glucose 4-epimerase
VALSRVLRRLGRRPLPVPPPAFGATVRLLGLGSLGPDVERYLRYGRGVDTGRMRRELGFVPRHTTLQAIEATASALGGGAGAGRGVPAGATA